MRIVSEERILFGNHTHESVPDQVHSNLSKMQSFSYRSHNFPLKWSWIGIVFTGLESMLISQILSDR